MLSVDPSPPLSSSHTHTHTCTHTQTYTNLHTHTWLLHALLIFHVNEISFSLPFWDTLRTCVQSILPIAISSFHLFSCVRLCATPWTAAHQDSLSITNSQSLLKLKSIESPMPSIHIIHSHPLLLGLHSFLASGFFPVRQFFASGRQSSGVAASVSVFLVNIRTDTTRPWSVGWMGTGRTRGFTSSSRLAVVAVRRYTSSKVRSSGCALLEQPWRDTTSKVRETHVRWYVLQNGIRGQTHRNHNHRNLVNRITLEPQPFLTQWN